jgi:lauroyl/myristoyl acyltransferase
VSSDSKASAGAPASAPAAPLISGGDVAIAFGLVVLGAIAWLCPPRWWPAFCRGLAPLSVPFVAGQRRAVTSDIAAIVGGQDLPGTPDTIFQAFLAAHIERKLQVLRVHLPPRWKPAIRLEGLEHVEAAQARGQGAILWVSDFAFASLIAKMGLARAGFLMSHLSHPHHGFSSTRFGMAVLNPVVVAAENRFLEERVVLSLASARPALDRLARRLGENGLVSITVRSTARRPLEVPLLDGRFAIAPGAPGLAHRSGAALLPVFVLPEGPDRFVVTVEAPIPVDASAPREAAVQAAAEAYAKRLEPYLLHAPGQWLGWTD